MDIDFAFIARLIEEGNEGYREIREKGFRPEFLQGPATMALEKIQAHERKFEKLPTMDILGRELGNITIEAPDVSNVTLPELMEGLELRFLQKELTSTMSEANKQLEVYQPEEARTILRKALRKLDEEGIGTDDSIADLSSLGEEVIQRYMDVKEGKIGVPTPWAALDDVTLGWRPEDVVVFVSRLGVGKSWTLLLCAKAAWEAGHKVLFITTEMAQVALAMRFFAAQFTLSYGEIRKARLGELIEKQFIENIRAFDSERRFLMSGGNFNIDIASIELLTERERPDLLVVDGLYLIQDVAGGNTDRFTRVGNNIESLKRLAKRRQIPILTSTQFNRKVSETKEESADVSKIGLSDLIGWASDYVIALIQTPKMRGNHIMKLRTLKVREDTRVTVTMNWDFDYMNFSEREVEREGDEGEATPEPDQAKQFDSSGKGSLKPRAGQDVNF